MNFGSAFSSRPGDEEVRIEITSLIDIVFLLLIFFMVSTTFITVPGMEVNLPRAEAARVEREKRELNLVINREGKIFLNRNPVERSELPAALEAAAGPGGSETLAVVRGDEGVNYGLVVEVMDLARRAGIPRLAIATDLPRPREKK